MGGEYIDVDCVTVPEIMQRVGWDYIDLLKVDIEGGEVALFKDASQWIGKVGVIVGELHNGYSVEDFNRDVGPWFTSTRSFEYPDGSMTGLLAVAKASAFAATAH